MDPFTQRMLERARARQEKIDQKLVSSGQTPKRKPLSDNIENLKKDSSPVKSPSKIARDSALSPKKSIKEPIIKSPRHSILKSGGLTSVAPQRVRNDIVVTKKEFKSPRSSKECRRRGSDVSVEINIMHRDDVQIEVQVEEREAPLEVVYSSGDAQTGVIVEEIQQETPRAIMSKEATESRTERTGLRQNVKSRLDRLGNLYSESPSLSSPIHRTEGQFTSGTPPDSRPRPADSRRINRLAALANQINNWEDDLSHHSTQPEPAQRTNKWQPKAVKETLESSTLDVSIHSLKDINHVLHSSNTQSPKGARTVKKSSSNDTNLTKSIVAGLERDGYRRISAGQSRLVFDFTADTPDPVRQEPSPATLASATPNMAAMVAPQPVAKKPSIKKYKAPTPPRQLADSCDSDKDKENNLIQREKEHDLIQDDTECKQTKPAVEIVAEKCSPVVKRLAPKLNGNADRNSVLSKAAMFEAGSPRAKEKDPAEMSLRERKALFEKNKGAAIIPKAPFGLAPSVKTLHGDKDKKPPTPTKPVLTNNSRANSKDNVAEDNISQSSIGGGIKGKLAALFNKEQTISETTIANKFKQEREKEMEMLQNRFNCKPDAPKPSAGQDSDDDDHDDHEKAPLMGSTANLAQAHRKPEIIANVPKVHDNVDKADAAESKDEDKAQPVKRRSSQDAPAVLSVLEDVKRIKVNNKQANGTVVQQPTSIYPHLSDIDTDNSHQDEHSDCGGSSTENIPDKMNKSDNWADTSFGREVMNVVKKNNTSYKKAVQSDSDESGAGESELDDLLDEALESEGPTPPKQNKQGSLSSTSFVYKEKAREFKSPLKGVPATPRTPHTPLGQRVDRGAELVHSVSFYRRMQNASSSSTTSTPLRVIRHSSPERDLPPPSAAPPLPVTTVRQRIKELHEEISKQQTVISQASQALNLCASTIEFSGSTEQAEGERLLLLATHRRQACLHEVQRLQVEGAGPASTAGMASLTMHGLNVPLRRDYVRHLNADGAVGHHAVCLLKCRDRVLATSMQLTRPDAHTLHFPDEVRMDGLSSDFKVTVEIYLLQASKEILPHNVKYHINKKSNSKLLTPKSKVSELKTPRVQSPMGPLSVRSPQFQPHGYCIFALSQASRNTFTLSKVPGGSPLEGSVNLEIKARVRVPAPEPHAAFLTAFDDVSGLGAWHRRYFRLQPPTLAYWKYPDDVHKKMPIGDINLSTVLSDKAVRCPRDLCARPNTILLESSVPAGLIIPDSGSLVYFRRGDAVVRRHLLAADTAKDRDAWIDCLNKALEYVRCISHEDDE